MTPLSFKRRDAARGFTLIELVIALGIGVGILLGLSLMFSSNSGNQQELERTLRQVENARFALDMLSEDLQHAGFYSDFNPMSVDRIVTSPDPCTVATNEQGWTEPDPTSVPPVLLRYPLPVVGIRSEPNDDSPAVPCLANRLRNTEAIVVRHAETTGAIPVAAARAGNLYIQTARCEIERGRLRIQPPPANNFNLLPANCAAGTVNNEVRRLLQRTYYVARCNDCAGAGDGIPTLKRVEMIDGALRTTSIAEGVENLQIEFGVDNLPAPPAGDGLPDVWRTTGTLPAADWPLLLPPGVPADDDRRNVVSVRVNILTRATQRTTGFVETRTYQVGPAVTLVPANLNDGFKRSLLSTSVRLINVGGRRE